MEMTGLIFNARGKTLTGEIIASIKILSSRGFRGWGLGVRGEASYVKREACEE